MADLVRVEGMSDIARNLKLLPEKLQAMHLKRAVASGAILVRNEARSRVPVDTGVLRKSVITKYANEQSSRQKKTYIVTVRRGKKYQRVKAKRGGKTVEINMDAFYWRFVEFGTQKMAPQPFMRPAFEQRKRDALEAVSAKLRIGVMDIAREFVVKGRLK